MVGKDDLLELKWENPNEQNFVTVGPIILDYWPTQINKHKLQVILKRTIRKTPFFFCLASCNYNISHCIQMQNCWIPNMVWCTYKHCKQQEIENIHQEKVLWQSKQLTNKNIHNYQLHCKTECKKYGKTALPNSGNVLPTLVDRLVYWKGFWIWRNNDGIPMYIPKFNGIRQSVFSINCNPGMKQL